MTKKLDVNQLKEMADRNPLLKNICKVLAKRKRNRRHIDLRRVRWELEENQVDYTPKEFFEVFKALEKAGAGNLTAITGKSPKWKWNFSQKLVANAALGKLPESEVEVKNTETFLKGIVFDNSLTSNGQVEKVFFGPGKIVEIPADLTPEERRWLAKVILRGG